MHYISFSQKKLVKEYQLQIPISIKNEFVQLNIMSDNPAAIDNLLETTAKRIAKIALDTAKYTHLGCAGLDMESLSTDYRWMKDQSLSFTVVSLTGQGRQNICSDIFQGTVFNRC